MVNERSQVREGEESVPKEIPQKLADEARSALASKDSSSIPQDSVSRADSQLESGDNSSVAGFAYHLHCYISDYVKFADQKAAFIFAINAALLGYQFKSKAYLMWLKRPSSWAPLDIICLLGMVLLSVGLVFSSTVVVPSLRKTHKGIVFFRSVSEYANAFGYASDVINSTPSRLTREVLEHAYDLSRICSSKYRRLVVATWSTSIGVVLTVLTLVKT
jgi:hypothetical protein